MNGQFVSFKTENLIMTWENKLLLVLLLFFILSNAFGKDNSPNVIIILSDDQGWGATSVLTDPMVKNSASDFMETPYLERLANSGMRFTNGYSPHPNCSPSRASIQTGKSPAKLHMTDIIERKGGSTKTGTRLVTPPNLRGLPVDEITIAEQIKKYRPEYATAHFGKWHLGSKGPEYHGYDSSDGITSNREGNQNYKDNPKDIFGISERGIRWMSEQVQAGKPFFMVLAHYATHKRIEYRKSTLKKYQKKPAGARHNNAEYAAMTEDLDSGVGMVMKELDELGIADNTYVIYLSDNGAFPFMNPENTNGPVRGWKATLWEGGIRTPFIISGPGIHQGTVCDERIVGWDLFPTICEWLNIRELPEGLEGGSLTSVLTNQGVGKVKRNNDFMVFHWPRYVLGKGGIPSTVIYKDSLKLHYFYESDEWKLFDIKNDLAENVILNDSLNEQFDELKILMKKYLNDIDAGIPTKNPFYIETNDPALNHQETINNLMSNEIK